MSVLLVPTFSEAFYTQTTDLDGKDYNLTFKHNQREDCWYLDIADSTSTLLVAGIKIVCDIALLGRFADSNLPPGELMAISSSNDTSPPGFEELGKGLRVELTYFTADELT